jgi:hypothetical protein
MRQVHSLIKESVREKERGMPHRFIRSGILIRFERWGKCRSIWSILAGIFFVGYGGAHPQDPSEKVPNGIGVPLNPSPIQPGKW